MQASFSEVLELEKYFLHIKFNIISQALNAQPEKGSQCCLCPSQPPPNISSPLPAPLQPAPQC